ncbi:MAG: HNH endonuclease [Hymenobacter sp.]|nr:MAG: HNH endonuclease [Hymenobacter sp.]
MASPRKFLSNDEEFRQAVAESLSVRQVLERVGLVPAGGNYKTVHNRIKLLELDTRHFTGKGWNAGPRYRMLGKPFSWEGILVENSPYTSTFRLRNRLIEYGLKEAKCENCNLAEWLGKAIPLELHHANGVNNDHRLANLQLLCPNCHALTENYRGKNQRKAGVVE